MVTTRGFNCWRKETAEGVSFPETVRRWLIPTITMTAITSFGKISPYCGLLYNGGGGIEKFFEYEMLSSDISFKSRIKYDEEFSLYPGNDVYLTLNTKLQQYACEALREGLQGSCRDHGALYRERSRHGFHARVRTGEWRRPGDICVRTRAGRRL